MTYTEEDEQRVYEEINRAVAKEMRSPSRLPQDEFMRHIARVALEAMEREPLENVVHDLHPGTKICHVWPLREGGYEAEIGVPVRQDRDGWWDHEMFRGEGATIDAAIRNAVAAAKGDE